MSQKSPSCSADFRRMRVYGDGISIDPSFDNTRSESIVNRLLKLLVFLDRAEPQQNWAGYLDNGALNWRRIAFAGQSQGAGMAAYIAKGQPVGARHSVFKPLGFFCFEWKASSDGALACDSLSDAARALVRRISRARKSSEPAYKVVCNASNSTAKHPRFQRQFAAVSRREKGCESVSWGGSL